MAFNPRLSCLRRLDKLHMTRTWRISVALAILAFVVSVLAAHDQAQPTPPRAHRRKARGWFVSLCHCKSYGVLALTSDGRRGRKEDVVRRDLVETANASSATGTAVSTSAGDEASPIKAVASATEQSKRSRRRGCHRKAMLGERCQPTHGLCWCVDYRKRAQDSIVPETRD